ncbi:type II toxin-antitoxin system RelE/ParE family toxin [Paucidesulfovibrio gracilis]|uniref:type II toxin-antitoxin system RelE/ParE family toxin n=1 Tax=Paucidesulfovibrio gracilis TaxID=47158 RepID=UPI00099AE2BA|nr:type II toxin-antitoxin system RelE/ParE family toxin [Paucidesulfovibrio gracilis]
MNVQFLACAEQEFTEAVAWYNEQSPGLGYDFAAEIKRTLSRMEKHPEAWVPISPRTRRIRVSRFPYSVIYQVRSEYLLVVAVMHMSRHPKRWEERI